MSGGGSKDQTVTNVNGPPEWMRPYAEGMMRTGMEVAQTPYQMYPGRRSAGLMPEHLTGMEMMTQRAINGSPLSQAGQNQLGRTINGDYTKVKAQKNRYNGLLSDVGENKYAGDNPYLSKMIDDSNSDIVTAYNKSAAPNLMAQFNSSGAFGGSAHLNAMEDSQRGLAETLAKNTTSIRNADFDRQVGLAESDISRRLGAQQSDFARNAGIESDDINRQMQQYQFERGNQLSALGMVPQFENADYQDAANLMRVGDMRQQWTNQGLLDEYNTWNEYQQYPFERMNFLSGLVYGSPYSQSTGPNPNARNQSAGALGGAMSGAATGYQMGGGWGALAGGVLGGLGGYYS